MAKNKKKTKLSLKKDTLRRLDAKQMEEAAGGTLYNYNLQLNYNLGGYSGACGSWVGPIGPSITKDPGGSY